MAGTKHKWFKFWANDFLGDADVDSTPDDAMVLIIKMWCICCLEGSCPANVEEIARKTRVPLHRVSHCVEHFKTFFEGRGDRLFSTRMERDRARSDMARKGAASRWNKGGSGEGSTERSPKRSAERNAKRIAPESQKARGFQGEQFSLTPALTMGLEVVEPVETVEIVEIVPRGAKSQNQNHKFPGMSLEEIKQRRRELEEQAQNLAKKGNVKSNPHPTFYPKAAEA